MKRLRAGIVHTSPLGALRRRGRPLGEIAQQMLRRIEHGPATLPTLAASMQLNYATAARTVHRLVSSGHARYGAAVPGQGGRPPRVVQIGSSTTSIDGVVQLDAALRLWVRG